MAEEEHEERKEEEPAKVFVRNPLDGGTGSDVELNEEKRESNSKQN